MSVIHAATNRRWRVWLEAVRMLFGGWRRLGCGAVVLHLMLLCPLGGYGARVSGDNTTCINDPSQCFREMLPIEEKRATACTRAFADRFGLEAPAPGTEPGNGLEALELRVQRMRDWDDICTL